MTRDSLRIMTIDCCEHIRSRLRRVPGADLLSADSRNRRILNDYREMNLIVIGIARYPIRRFFVTQLRRVFPEIPILILRREPQGELAERIKGEFLLSDLNNYADCETVQSVRKVMPFESCSHISHGRDYEIVRELMIALAKMYPDTSLNLAKVAREINASPKRVSTILNNHVGVSFPELLRHVRVEEAKRLLGTRQYSVKEIAVRVGFTDSHYFSKSFKQLTGQNASDYRETTTVLN